MPEIAVYSYTARTTRGNREVFTFVPLSGARPVGHILAPAGSEVFQRSGRTHLKVPKSDRTPYDFFVYDAKDAIRECGAEDSRLSWRPRESAR